MELVLRRAIECPLWFSVPVALVEQSWESRWYRIDQTGPLLVGPLALPEVVLQLRVMRQGNFLAEPDVVEEVLDAEASELRAWQQQELRVQRMDYRFAEVPAVGRSRTTDRQNRVSDWESAGLSWTPDWALW